MPQAEPPYSPTKEETERFFKAIEGGDFKYVRETVVQHPEAVNWKHGMGFCPLQWSFMGVHKGGDYAAIPDYLIDKGADVNAMQPIPGGSPMLICAIIDGTEELALRLVDKGADIAWKSPARPAPNGFPELEDRGGGTVLMYAAGWDCLKLAKVLLDRGADINEKDANGKTAVMNAAYAGKADMVEFLVSRGASLEGRTVNGDDIRALARKEHKQRALPAVEEAFRRVCDEATKSVQEGLEQPMTVSRKLQLRPGNN